MSLVEMLPKGGSGLYPRGGLSACVNRDVIFVLRDRFLSCPLPQNQSLAGHLCRHAYSDAGNTVAHPADSSGDYHREGDILYSPFVSYTPPLHDSVCSATTMDCAQLGQSQVLSSAFAIESERPSFSKVTFLRNGKESLRSQAL
jgi:hypothetical protein